MSDTTDSPHNSPGWDRFPGRVEFDIPFAPRVNPHMARASSHLMSWLTCFGLLRSPEAVDHFVSWRPAELPARWYPDAAAGDLELATDLLGWLMLLDDQFDGRVGQQPDQTAHVVTDLTGIFDHREDGRETPASAASNALADLWARERVGMTTEWQTRAARNWRDYLLSFVAEAHNRRTRHMPDVVEYLELRDKTGVMYVLLDAAERIGHYEADKSLYESQPFQEMYRLTVLVGSIVNDLLGLEKEESRGDPHNLVLVLQHHRRCSRSQALAESVGMVREWTDRFLRLEALIPGICDQLGIPASDRIAGYRLISDMRAAMRASYDWCAISNRYSTESITFLGAAGCLADIATTPSHP